MRKLLPLLFLISSAAFCQDGTIKIKKPKDSCDFIFIADSNLLNKKFKVTQEIFYLDTLIAFSSTDGKQIFCSSFIDDQLLFTCGGNITKVGKTISLTKEAFKSESENVCMSKKYQLKSIMIYQSKKNPKQIIIRYNLERKE